MNLRNLLAIAVLLFHYKEEVAAKSSEYAQIAELIFRGTIKIHPQCPGSVCFGQASCTNHSVLAIEKCVECPPCGPQGQPCPLYGCSESPRHPLYDKDGCIVCNVCDPETENCADLDCVTPESCGSCAELYTSRVWNNYANCSECRRPKHSPPLRLCADIKCAEPACPFGTFAIAKTDDSGCCRTCNECQPLAECESLICEDSTCPSGSVLTARTDARGCKLCAVCKACPLLNCGQPTCGNCSEAIVPMFANGCPACPECRTKTELPTCDDVECSASSCKHGGIAYVKQNTSECCTGCVECQPLAICLSVTCDETTCNQDDYKRLAEQYDINGCKMCKKCASFSHYTYPGLRCNKQPTDCPPCHYVSAPLLWNDYYGCGECHEFRDNYDDLPCRKCEKMIKPETGCRECQLQPDCPYLVNCAATPPVCGKCSKLTSPTFADNSPGCAQCQYVPRFCPFGQCKPPCKSYIHYYETNCCTNCTYECQPKDDCPIMECDHLCPTGYKSVYHSDSIDENGCKTACPDCLKIE